MGANLFVLALSGLSLYESRQQHELRTQLVTREMARAIDLGVSNSIEKINMALQAVADGLESQLQQGTLDAGAVDKLLNDYQQRLPEVEAVRVARADGLVVFGKGLTPQSNASWADRDYFIHLREHPEAGLQISKPRVGRVAQKYIVGFARRYNYPDGSFAGVISAPIALEHFTQLLSQFNMGPKGTVVLRDTDLGLIARYPAIQSGPAATVGNQSVSPELQALVRSGSPSATYHTPLSADQMERIVSFRRITQAPMIVIAAMASEDYLTEWREEVYRAIAWFIGFALLSSFCAWFAAQLLKKITQESIRNRLFLHHASDAIHILDPQGRLVQVSDSFCTLLGYTHAELIGMNASLWGSSYAAEPLLATEAPDLDNQEDTRTFETKLHKKDGELIEVEVSTTRFLMENKPYLFASARDITRRKQMEAVECRLRESLVRLNEIAAFIHLPINEQLRQALSIGAHHLGLELGIVSHVSGDTYTVITQVSPPGILQDGQAFSYSQTYCAITLAQNQVVAIGEMGKSEHLSHPCYQAFKLEAYIGAPVLVGGAIFGTVNFSSPLPYPRGFDAVDKEFVALLARWIGSALERDQAQKQVMASQAHLQAIIENEPECVKVVSKDGILLQMNRTGLSMLEARDVDEVNDCGLFNFIVPEFRPAFIALNDRIFQGESGTLEFMVDGRHGTRRWLETHATPLRDEAGNIVSQLAVTRDITLLKEQQSQLEYMAHYDPLTKLPNRALLSDRMGQALAQARRAESMVAVGYLDLDGFKAINDNFGHNAGDNLLIEVAQRLNDNMRKGDTAARLGGDEFVLLLVGIQNDEEWQVAAERMLKALAAPFLIEGQAHHISGSLGITLFPEDDNDPDTLLRHADQAMYSAKQSGKNRYQRFG